MKSYALFVLATALILATLASSASAQSLVIENFNEYATNTALATLNNSPPAPWIEFGYANNGYFTSKSDAAHEVVASPSASAPAIWNNVNGKTFTLRYDFTYAGHIGVQNLTSAGYNYALINVRSNTAGTTAALQLSFTDGNTAYTSTVVTPISSSAQVYYFPLSQSSFTVASGTEPFSTVFSQISSIGFVASNTMSSPTVNTESILFDDFSLSATPEPGSASLIGAAAVASMLMKRRRDPRRTASRI